MQWPWKSKESPCFTGPGADPYPANPVLKKLNQDEFFTHNGQKWPTDFCTPSWVCEHFGKIILENNLKRGLEIGTLFGLSTLYHAEALLRNGGHLDTVDIRYKTADWGDGRTIENVHEVAERLVKESGFESVVTFRVGASQNILPDLYRAGARYDYCYIDGNHTYCYSLLDFLFVDAMVDVGGFISMDDVGVVMAKKDYTDGGPNRLLPMIFASNRFKITPVSGNVIVCQKMREAGQ